MEDEHVPCMMLFYTVLLPCNATIYDLKILLSKLSYRLITIKHFGIVVLEMIFKFTNGYG